MATETAGQRRAERSPVACTHAAQAARTSAHAVRPMRADARRNYERLLIEARTAFTDHGTDTSLEDIARRAGVGIGTLYRHFPNRTALMGAVFQGEVDALLTHALELADAPQPCAALVEWLRAIITARQHLPRAVARPDDGVGGRQLGDGAVQRADAGGGRRAADPCPEGRGRTPRCEHQRSDAADQRHRAGRRGIPGRPASSPTGC